MYSMYNCVYMCVHVQVCNQSINQNLFLNNLNLCTYSCKLTKQLQQMQTTIRLQQKTKTKNEKKKE